MFELGNFENLIPLIEDVEDRIALLRKYASRLLLGIDPCDVIIRYRPDGLRTMHKSQKATPSSELEEHRLVISATRKLISITNVSDLKESKELSLEQLQNKAPVNDSRTMEELTSIHESKEFVLTITTFGLGGYGPKANHGVNTSSIPSDILAFVQDQEHDLICITYPVTNNTYGFKLQKGVFGNVGLEGVWLFDALRSRLQALLEVQRPGDIKLFHGPYEVTGRGKYDFSSGCILTCTLDFGSHTSKTNIADSQRYEYVTALPRSTPVQTYYRWFDSRLQSRPICQSNLFLATPFQEELIQKQERISSFEPHPTKLGSEKTTEVMLKFGTRNPFAHGIENCSSGVDSNTDATAETPGFDGCPPTSAISSEKVTESIPENEFTYFLGDPKTAAIYIIAKAHKPYSENTKHSYWAAQRLHLEQRVALKNII